MHLLGWRRSYYRRMMERTPQMTQTEAPKFNEGDRIEEVSQMLKSLVLAIGFPEEQFARTVKLDDIADGDGVSRSDLTASIVNAFSDVDAELIAACETVGDTIDLIVGTERDAWQESVKAQEEAAEEDKAREAAGLEPASAPGYKSDEGDTVSTPPQAPPPAPETAPGDPGVLDPPAAPAAPVDPAAPGSARSSR